MTPGSSGQAWESRKIGNGQPAHPGKLQGDIMTSTRVLTVLALAVLVLVAPAARAQYMYLDSNGNGVHDSGDQLAANGTATTVDLWINTNHNRDGSVATCNVDPTQELSIHDYYFNLQASGGQVSYGGFVTHMGNIAFPVVNPGDGIQYANGQGGNVQFPPGTYHLATLTITGTSGAPTISIVDRVTASNTNTAFGTNGSLGCFGNDFDNTYKLAGPSGSSDWTDADGLAAAGGCFPATAFTTNANKQINLGKQGTCVQIQPLNASFPVGSVVLSSIVMRSPGTGAVSEIPADAGKTTVDGDKNGDGIAEITACFTKTDLQQLFSGVSGTQMVPVTLQGNISGGGQFCASVTLTVKAGSGSARISPNPLNPSAVLTFVTSRAGAVRVQLFDAQGRLIKTLVDQPTAEAGYHDVAIDGRDGTGKRLASGIYYLKINSIEGTEAKAVTILK